jgi:hypothetical protein
MSKKLTRLWSVMCRSGSSLLSFPRITSLTEMSIRSSMSRPLPSILPEQLRTVLELRGGDVRCPVAVETALGTIPYFRARPAAAPAPVPSRGGGGGSGRFAGLSAHTNSWNRGPPPPSDDGFQPAHRRDRRPPPRAEASEDGWMKVGGGRRPQTVTAPPQNTIVDSTRPDTESTVAKFSSSAIRENANVEDRILAKVKGKVNKIGPHTYDATKAFMQQILDSDNTEFLDDFMKYIFQKAATESTFCSLYARLLHELADEFKHLRTVMTSLFRDYIIVFTEVESSPDVGSENYKIFLEAQERKKFRRGYSQFVGELVKLGEADTADFSHLMRQIVTVLETKHADSSATLLCEEYVDCLANMSESASAILGAAEWSEEIKTRIKTLSSKPRPDVPGFTNKARFALMDLVEFAERGWKK